MNSILMELSDLDRDILKRYYLLEQSESRICSELNITESQIRALQANVKTRWQHKPARP